MPPTRGLGAAVRDLRSRSRFRAHLASGEPWAVVMTRGRVLRDGDLLLADDGRVIQMARHRKPSARRAAPMRGCWRAPPITWATATSPSGRAGLAALRPRSRARRHGDGTGARSRRRAHAVRARGRRLRAHGPAHPATAIDAARPAPRPAALCHLVSPALPVGAYAYSQGLEYAVRPVGCPTRRATCAGSRDCRAVHSVLWTCRYCCVCIEPGRRGCGAPCGPGTRGSSLRAKPPSCAPRNGISACRSRGC